MSDTQFRDTIKTLLVTLASNDAAQRQEARKKIRDTLAANRKSWNDLIPQFCILVGSTAKNSRSFSLCSGRTTTENSTMRDKK
jgi:hypothetical protein